MGGTGVAIGGAGGVTLLRKKGRRRDLKLFVNAE